MKEILKTAKKYILWIFGGLVTILGILFAIRYEREKINKIKTKVKIDSAKSKIDSIDEHQDILDLKDDWFEEKEKKLDDEIKKSEDKIKNLEDQIAEEKKKLEDMSDAEMSDEFNRLYPDD